MKHRLLIAALLAFSLTATAQTTTPTSPTSTELQAEIVSIPVKGAGARGADVVIPVHVFRPTLSQANAGAGPWPVVIFSHGRATTVEERQAVRSPVLFGHVRYWHAKGYAVIAPVRPGYGDNTAHDPETSGIRMPPEGGPCTGLADYAKVAAAATHALRTTHEWLIAQSWANKERILLVGQSVGGLTTVAACGQNLPGVIGCVNFAGGSGGNPKTSPNASCQPDRLRDVLANAGKTTQVPSLWLYSSNDLYWGEQAPKQWHQAHVEASTAASQKHSAEFFAAPPVEPDGHRLLAAGGRFWSPPLNAWLKKNGFEVAR
jgi:dienelactone hydrolase